jgi:multidrug efflux pump subunit AcrA (membrane-fusion protein)
MLKIIIISSMLVAGVVGAQTPDKRIAQISPEQRAVFWRAQAEQLAAQMRLEMANRQLQAAREAMVKACVEAELVSDSGGEPMCHPKPDAGDLVRK